MLNGDVLTDVDLGELVRRHDAAARRRHHRAHAGPEPVGLRPRRDRRDRPRAALPREAEARGDHDRHDQRRHLRPRDPRPRADPAGREALDRARVLPRPAGARRPRARARPPRLLDRHRDARRSTCQVHRDILRGRFRVALEAEPRAGGFVARGARIAEGAGSRPPSSSGRAASVAAGVEPRTGRGAGRATCASPRAPACGTACSGPGPRSAPRRRSRAACSARASASGRHATRARAPCSARARVRERLLAHRRRSARDAPIVARHLQGLRHPRPLSRRARRRGLPPHRARLRRLPGRASGSRSAATAGCPRRELAAAFVAGARAQGAAVTDIGVASTDMLYYYVARHDLDGGAIVTASHNPKEWNGAKLVRRGALALSGDAGIKEIRDWLVAGRYADPAPPRGELTSAVASDDYARHCLSFVDPSRIPRLKVVLDTANGMGAVGVAGDLRRAADRDDPPLLRARRHLPEPPRRPAAWRRTAATSWRACGPSGPTSASPGTATPTAASSWTTMASSCPATS